MNEPLSVVVPARNEADTIGRVIKRLLPQPWAGEVIVVDNGSSDDTAAVAEAAGARTVFEPRPGMGHAVRAGLGAATYDWIMKVDADLDRFDTTQFSKMVSARGEGIGLVKGNWQDPNDNMPMTRLLVMPAIAQLAPGLSTLRAPNSGIYVVNRTCIAHQEIVGSYAADLDVMLRVYASGARVVEVGIGQISHDTRDLGHYNAMADTIMSFFMDRSKKNLTRELVVVANDAVEVMTTALGVLAARARAGTVVTLYLDQSTTPEADILREVLSPFPTVRILPMDVVSTFRPRGPDEQVNIFAPYPSAHKTDALRAALHVQNALQSVGCDAEDVLLMPSEAKRDAVRAFKADFVHHIGEGAIIKANALSKLAVLDGKAPEPIVERESFQSYASLPDALKLDMTRGASRVEASGPA